MSFLCAPTNVSLLQPGNFRVFIHKAPYITFFTQTVALPSISLSSIKESNPFTDMNFAGDHIEWDPLSVVFLVDEDLQGYREAFHWIQGLGFPETFDQYKELLADPEAFSNWDAITSPLSVFTNTGSNNANIEYIFHDAKPISVSAPTMTTTNEGMPPVVTAKVMFDYTYFEVRSVKAN